MSIKDLISRILLLSQYLTIPATFYCSTPVSLCLDMERTNAIATTKTTMCTSKNFNRFLTVLLCIVFPIYLAVHNPTLSSDFKIFLSTLPERARAVYVALSSPLPDVPLPLFRELPQPSAKVARASRTVRTRERRRYPSLPNGLAHCINSFEQYSFPAEQVLERKLERYEKQTPAQKAISNKLGYPSHFEKAREGIEVNAKFTDQVAHIARKTYRTGPHALEDEEAAAFGIVDLAFGHLSRDWSAQGAKERRAAFPPILDGLKNHFGDHERGKKVLVPGSGMGRLASDIADLGTYTLYFGISIAA